MCRSKAGSLFIALCLLLVGCGGQMGDQPRYEPLEYSDFFPNGRSSRDLVAGTVARGQLRDDELLYTGRMGQAATNLAPGAAGGDTAVATPAAGEGAAQEGASATAPPGGGRQQAQPEHADLFPFPVTVEVLARGQERYNIFCAPCHDQVGSGNGIIVRRGYSRPPSFHIERLREAPAGHFYDVITNGYGAMPTYAPQVPVRDRWAIVAYIRALQLSQNATLDDVPADQRGQLAGGGP